jgi:hypothetical protein
MPRPGAPNAALPALRAADGERRWLLLPCAGDALRDGSCVLGADETLPRAADMAAALLLPGVLGRLEKGEAAVPGARAAAAAAALAEDEAWASEAYSIARTAAPADGDGRRRDLGRGTRSGQTRRRRRRRRRG